MEELRQPHAEEKNLQEKQSDHTAVMHTTVPQLPTYCLPTSAILDKHKHQHPHTSRTLPRLLPKHATTDAPTASASSPVSLSTVATATAACSHAMASILMDFGKFSAAAAAAVGGTVCGRSFTCGSQKRARSDAVMDVEKHPRKRKWRKPTYLVRKEERDVLLEQIYELQNHIELLQYRTGTTDWRLKDKQLLQKEMSNHVLREAVRNHQFALIGAQSALSEATLKIQETYPLSTYIHLGLDWTQRHETLMSLKSQKIHEAVQFLAKRTQFLTDPAQEHSEIARFSTPSGDYCAIHFDVIPLDDTALKNVQHAFDVVCFYVRHMDPTSQESLKNMVPYDNSSENNSIVHRRVKMADVGGVLTESNFVVFAQCSEHCGVIVIDSVDVDELYPYRQTPSTCRQDVSAVLSITTQPRRVKQHDGKWVDEQVLVLTRWGAQKLYHNAEMTVPPAVVQEIKQRLHEVPDSLLHALKQLTVPVDA